MAFGYDMDNMKACAWVEGEMPLTRWDDAIRDRMDSFGTQRDPDRFLAAMRRGFGAAKAYGCGLLLVRQV